MVKRSVSMLGTLVIIYGLVSSSHQSGKWCVCYFRTFMLILQTVVRVCDLATVNMLVILFFFVCRRGVKYLTKLRGTIMKNCAQAVRLPCVPLAELARFVDFAHEWSNAFTGCIVIVK